MSSATFYKRYFRMHYSKNEFARGNSHINGIESFWGYAKTRLVKFTDKPEQVKEWIKICLIYTLKNVNLDSIIASKILLAIFRKKSLKLS
jgi:alpha-D-ribose 1-methylphosphonate 5-phosphate C-P lyase